MDIVTTIKEIRQEPRLKSMSVGLVPTMGSLHQGHLALIRRAISENQVVVVSIFVNPTQFNDTRDLENYPRDLDADLAVLEKEKVDIVYLPLVEEIYPPGFDTWVDPGKLGTTLEGIARPGHFRGVATVVAKLFNVIRPDRAYFGQKDGQQVAVIKHVAMDLNIPVEILVVDTVREWDGLPYSSRNIQLTPQWRIQAGVIYKSMLGALQLFKEGERSVEKLRAHILETLLNELNQEQIEYIDIVNADTMDRLHYAEEPSLILVAVRFGKTRLIDNLNLTRQLTLG